MEPAMFSVASMFDPSSSEDENEEEAFVIRDHKFPGMVLHVREFAFHQVNANLLWPGALLFADWIVEHEKLFRGRRILELGSGTGALAIFLRKTLALDITTSDYDDVEIENNIKFNCELNDLASPPHIRHTWGDTFPEEKPYWDLIIASDILLYVKQYANLIKTLTLLFRTCNPVEIIDKPSFLCSSKSAIVPHETVDGPDVCTDIDKQIGASDIAKVQKIPLLDAPITQDVDDPPSRETDLMLPRPCFLMSWRRRIPKEDEAKFFEGCRGAGFTVDDLRSRVYSIYPALSRGALTL